MGTIKELPESLNETYEYDQNQRYPSILFNARVFIPDLKIRKISKIIVLMGCLSKFLR